MKSRLGLYNIASGSMTVYRLKLLMYLFYIVFLF